MGVKVLQCFPWSWRKKERKTKRSEETAPQAPPPEKPKLQSTSSVTSDTDSHQKSAYFSGKARVSFRHQMDSAMFANDSTF
ncbi:Hypothetical predicted protein [Pelobates cultripes]|uniref:Uncharacterized protein n=1 Tax=Pelobates cultripes TaxID=61616 RepID=A0AAD1VX59_PELCU|nr:Hypothetical predicted protein [Pelobates cultripes]